MNNFLYDHFFLDKIIKSFSLVEKKKICVAVSGGLDSMVLLNLLLLVPNLTLEVAHCNFTLRDKESNEDENFVKNFCIKKHILCHVKKFNTFDFSKKNKFSIQMAARELRYGWFEDLLEKYSYEHIALGHHLSDSVETFFINIIRGTGLKGLLGIPRENRKFIRPLSSFTKEEIFHYAKMRKINWRLDKSNQENKYLRNKIRLITSTFSDTFYKGFKKSIKYLHKENLVIEREITKINKEITLEKKENPFFWKIECKKIKELQSLSFYLFKLFFPYGFSNIENLKNLLYAQSGKQLFSKKYRIIKNRNHWILVKNQNSSKKIYMISNLKDYKKTSLPIHLIFFFDPKKENIIETPFASFIDLDKIQFPLQLRTWRKGDFFYPLNMKGKKKLSKYYKDKKFSLFEKEHTWLLVNGNDKIIWIVGNRLDDRFKVTEKTRRVLGIKI